MLSGSFGPCDGKWEAECGAQALTLPSVQDKLVFYTRSLLTERVQLLKGLKTTDLLDPPSPEILKSKRPI